MNQAAFDRLKRVIDVVVAGLALVFSLPVQGAVALLVAIRLGRPVLFRQVRPGLRGEPFTLVKFRTMRPVEPDRGWADDASRLTAFGHRLRSTSLDELPTLWNIVCGEMSLVGPRPLLMQYLSRYTTDQARRHEVRPGLTGLAQVSGRNTLGWEKRLRLDVLYVDQRCITLDIRIALRTVSAVLRHEGITGEGHATMAEFTGTKPTETPS